jgi:hypothetical protein
MALANDGRFWAFIVVFTAVVGGVNLAGPSHEQQAYAKLIHISDDDFLKQACETKKTCAAYSEALHSCAVAGDIDRCIAIKMGTKSHSVCDATGESLTYPKDWEPTFVQCLIH